MARPLKKESVLEKKPAPRKGAGKAILRAKKGAGKKGGVIRLTHAKDTSKKSRIVIADNTKRKEIPAKTTVEKSVVVRSQMQLALLSPFRFPIPREQFVGSIARYSGVFFVVVGAFFSLLNLPYANGTYIAQQAQVTGAITTTVSTIDGGVLTNTKPTPKISIEGGSSLSSVSPIIVTVPNASEVQIILNDRQTGKLIPLGGAVSVDTSTWQYYWDTTKFPDGEYRIKTVIKNPYGTYDYTESTTYTISNASVSNSDTTDEDTKVVSSAIPQVGLEIGEDPSVDGNIPLEVYAIGATEVKVYARNTKSGLYLYLGYAKKHDSTLWIYDWDTHTAPDGEYRVHAKVKIGGQEYESPFTPISIYNAGSEKFEAEVTENENGDVPLNTEETVTVEDMSEEDSLVPTIELEISGGSTLSGFASLSISTSPVSLVELFVLPKNSLTPRFLGVAQKISPTSWKYVWDTKQSPNGDYALYARVKSEYGFTEGDKESVRVFNYVLDTFTKEQEVEIDTLQTIKDSLVHITESEELSASSTPSFETIKPVYIKPVEEYIETIDVQDEERMIVESLLTNFRLELKIKLSELARAKRSGDIALLEQVQNDIESLKESVLAELPSSIEKIEIIDDINAYLAEVSSKLQELTIRNEKILAEREGDEILKDSDKDGITDYDEINLYGTNPFAADTDGDGYIDSVEIELGYNPNDSSTEALITYESPKEAGVVREDLLEITSITGLTLDTETERNVPQRALIAGKGLPNSFVTLYIFSTPIVVTVKTDAEGGWSYVFDKELEDGTHEVYVGITDNGGRIVAKSNPISFVKTAEAFTSTNTSEEVVAQTAPETTLIPQNAMLLIASIAVVAIGLILILLGLHIHGVPGRKVVIQETQPA